MSIDSSRGNAQSSSSIAVPSAALTASGISSSDSWIFSSGPSIWPEAIRNRIAYPIWPAAPVTTSRAIYEFILSIRATRRAFSMHSIGRRGSIPLARVMGIRIGVDPSWFFILFLYIWILSSGYKDTFGHGQDDKAFGLAVLSAFLFFASVVLHELGHAVVARRNGISITNISLWMFGGMADLRSEPRTPGAELRIAAAGPAMTLLVIVASIAAGFGIYGASEFEDALALQARSNPPGGAVVLGWFANVNVFVLIVNLLPALPL